MLLPTLIKLGSLFVRERECSLAVSIGEALPERQRKLDPFTGWKLQKFCEGVGSHAGFSHANRIQARLVK